MRRDVQEIFRNTPHGKQVMMFSATLSKDIRPVCKKFMQDVNDFSTSTTTITTTPRIIKESYCVGGKSFANVWDGSLIKI